MSSSELGVKDPEKKEQTTIRIRNLASCHVTGRDIPIPSDKGGGGRDEVRREPGGRSGKPTWASHGMQREEKFTRRTWGGQPEEQEEHCKGTEVGVCFAKKVNMVGDEAGPAGRLHITEHLIFHVKR